MSTIQRHRKAVRRKNRMESGHFMKPLIQIHTNKKAYTRKNKHKNKEL
jgi:hypothetical protein